jgi:hypothetical protein
LQPVNRNQLLWHAVDVEKLVGPDHLVRAIWELVGQLDLGGYTAAVKSVEGVAGRPPYDPRLLISLWIYAYSQLENVVHDGTKVKASASGNSFHREKTLRAHLEAARKRVQEMSDPREEESSRCGAARERAAREKVEKLELALKEMEKVQAAPEAHTEKSQRRVSETEPEARIMKQGDGGCAPSHNVQISTDTAHGIIVGASVTQAASDEHELVPAMEEVERRTGQQPEHLIVLEGYTTQENVLAAMVPPPLERAPDPGPSLRQFVFNAVHNQAPAGAERSAAVCSLHIWQDVSILSLSFRAQRGISLWFFLPPTSWSALSSDPPRRRARFLAALGMTSAEGRPIRGKSDHIRNVQSPKRRTSLRASRRGEANGWAQLAGKPVGPARG